MPRTIVYDEPVVQVEIAKELKPGRPDTPTGPKAATRRTAREQAKKAGPNQQAAAADNPVKDDIPAKLAKYVPGEVVAVAIPAFAAFDPTGNWVWFTLALLIAANLLYLVVAATKLKPESRPRWYFYVLSIVAFGFWAAATIPQVRDKFGLEGDANADKAAYLLVIATFAIPLLDSAFDAFEIQSRT